MSGEKDSARSIIEGIVGEIEARIATTGNIHRDDLLPFQEKLRQVRESVSAECRQEIPEKYLIHLEETLGSEFLEAFHKGKLGSLFRSRRRLHTIYTKLAVLVESLRCCNQEALSVMRHNSRLQAVRSEMIESQVEQMHEFMLVEAQWKRLQIMCTILLSPFETAIKKVLTFLEAEQLEVFLFDEDKFLASELKTDGKTFTYNKEDERHFLPEAVRELQLKEVQEAILEMPMKVDGRQIGHFRIKRRAAEDLDKEQWKRDVAWISPALARIIESNRDRGLAHKVYIDDLTQLNNKRKLNEQMGKLFKKFKTGQKKLFVAMLDIDHFKKINDTYGHAVGDEILKKTATMIKEGVPNAYRYGGEEFCAVFYGFDQQKTMEMMENLRFRIENSACVIDGNEYRITLSSGVAEFKTFMSSVMDAIDQADQALYASKEDGRNRCTWYEDVKHRFLANQAQLRSEILQLKERLQSFHDLQEENKQLREKLTRDRRTPLRPGASANKGPQ